MVWSESAPRFSVNWMRSLAAGRVSGSMPPLTEEEWGTVGRHWSLKARLSQIEDWPPPRLRLLLGGRGSGKTFAGAGWVNNLALEGRRIALVGPSLHDVREVMVEGPSGIRALALEGRAPRWETSRRRLVWDQTGAVAQAFSAEDADGLRGPQFHAAWADEFCAWRGPDRVLSNLRLGLRLGDRPQLLVTTTPRPIPPLRRLIAEPGAVVVRMPTTENAENLAPGFAEALHALYGGTRLAKQELEGLIVESEGALFRAEDLARARGSRPARFETVVVAVDPPASAGGDACGIVAVGRSDGRAFVLGDWSEGGLSPGGWARKVAAAAEAFGAAKVVAEKNQGGEMVRTVLAQNGCAVAVKLVHASRSKVERAAPVAALYEQGRVVHCGAFPALEEELMALGGSDGGPSPDRADALVWAVMHLLPPPKAGPSIRVL
jgi:phage terminase large subunit-like protein